MGNGSLLRQLGRNVQIACICLRGAAAHLPHFPPSCRDEVGLSIVYLTSFVHAETNTVASFGDGGRGRAGRYGTAAGIKRQRTNDEMNVLPKCAASGDSFLPSNREELSQVHLVNAPFVLLTATSLSWELTKGLIQRTEEPRSAKLLFFSPLFHERTKSYKNY